MKVKMLSDTKNLQITAFENFYAWTDPGKLADESSGGGELATRTLTQSLDGAHFRRAGKSDDETVTHGADELVESKSSYMYNVGPVHEERCKWSGMIY